MSDNNMPDEIWAGKDDEEQRTFWYETSPGDCFDKLHPKIKYIRADTVIPISELEALIAKGDGNPPDYSFRQFVTTLQNLIDKGGVS